MTPRIALSLEEQCYMWSFDLTWFDYIKIYFCKGFCLYDSIYPPSMARQLRTAICRQLVTHNLQPHISALWFPETSVDALATTDATWTAVKSCSCNIGFASHYYGSLLALMVIIIIICVLLSRSGSQWVGRIQHGSNLPEEELHQAQLDGRGHGGLGRHVRVRLLQQGRPAAALTLSRSIRALALILGCNDWLTSPITSRIDIS